VSTMTLSSYGQAIASLLEASETPVLAPVTWRPGETKGATS